ncbi:aconitase X [Paracoccus ravus]|uniref:cis-3-hydroxy-L-proline dehydratase n=1 Tax=Paracoccus ravus TaxID=2447760 RepID=UPI00106E6CDC|nr:aconitase X [Paracoccus ravus]
MSTPALRILPGMAEGPVLALSEGLSFWGGVDPVTARIIDAHHPAHGESIAGKVLMMPTSRGSCSGSGVVLDLILKGNAPAALIFSEPEDILTLGSLIGAEMFGKSFPILRVSEADYARLAALPRLAIHEDVLFADGLSLPITAPHETALTLSENDRAMLAGRDGEAAALALRIICAMAHQQGAAELTDISRGHIDGCILAHPANLIFAEKMDELGAKVRVPTTINAISVDREHWQDQGVPALFGNQASRLADAYTRMGCQPSFTCAPYLLSDRPQLTESIAWAESNAVIYANSVLGARSPKHPDFLDLCMAVTGRAPLAGVYLDEGRKAGLIVNFDLPEGTDDSVWPLIGYLAGLKSPDRIPLLCGLAPAQPSKDDLKALCAAFGTTSAAPMLHIEAVTPEAEGAAAPGTPRLTITRVDLAEGWALLNQGPDQVDLIAIGSPHASLAEFCALAKALAGRKTRIPVIVTAGREIIAQARAEGCLDPLAASGVQILPDLCWCSITEPVFPPEARVVMTNSGKYAHYGPGLSGRDMRFGSLADCVTAAMTGHAPPRPKWLA